jgi:phytoene dehydrogenase-like protein
MSLPRDASDAAASITRYSPRDAQRWGPFTHTLRELARFLEALYQVPPPDIDTSSLGDLPSLLGLGRSYRSLGKANMSELLRVLPMPVQDLVDEWFTYEPLKAAIAGAAVRDIRQGPRSGGTSFVLLHYLAGAAAGSIRGRPALRQDAMLAAASAVGASAGVVVRDDVEVAKVVVRNDAVTGVALMNGDELTAPMVLSTEGPARTFLEMVDPVWLDPEFLLAVRNIRFRGSAAMVYYALESVPDLLAADDPLSAYGGVIGLSDTTDTIERAYDASKYGTVAERPHIEFGLPSRLWEGCVPAPHNAVLSAKVHYSPRTLRDGAHWDAARANALGDKVTAALSKAIPKLADVIRGRIVLSPRDLEHRFGLTEGAVTHGEMTLDQILFMRPVAGWGQYATPIRGLYLGGPGTHPGPGVFGMSGLLAARRMLADSRTRK